MFVWKLFYFAQKDIVSVLTGATARSQINQVVFISFWVTVLFLLGSDFTGMVRVTEAPAQEIWLQLRDEEDDGWVSRVAYFSRLFRGVG